MTVVTLTHIHTHIHTQTNPRIHTHAHTHTHTHTHTLMDPGAAAVGPRSTEWRAAQHGPRRVQAATPRGSEQDPRLQSRPRPGPQIVGTP
jgi:hypothetical protein